MKIESQERLVKHVFDELLLSTPGKAFLQLTTKDKQSKLLNPRRGAGELFQ